MSKPYFVIVIVVSGLFACGHISFERQASTDDPTDGDIGTDGDASIGMFGVPDAIEELNSPANEIDPTLTRDLLEICFASDRPGGAGCYDIYCSTRISTTMPWANPVRVAELSSPECDHGPGLSGDGLTIYLVNHSGLNPEIFRATRATREDPWSVPQRVDELAEVSTSLYDPEPTLDHRELWYVRYTEGPYVGLPHVATRTETSAPWTPMVVDIDPSAVEPCPRDSVVYFVKPISENDGNIWRVPRLGPTTFGTPEPVSELSSTDHESGPWSSEDLQHLWFTRGGIAEPSDLFVVDVVGSL